MAHDEHMVTDTDNRFVIDSITREIKNESGKTVLVQGDHNSEVILFTVPTQIEGHIMHECNVVQVHYTNIDSATKAESDGIFETRVQTKAVIGGTESESICHWLISSNATRYVGKLIFSITFQCVADDGTIEYAWSTGEHDSITVKPRRYNSEAVVAEYVDVLEQWRQELALAGIVEQYTPEEARAELGAASEAYVDEKVAAIQEVYFTATIGTSWSGSGPYTQDITVTGILASDKPTMDIVPSSTFATAEAQLEAYENIYRFTTAANKITVYSKEKTTTSIPIQLKAVRT